MKQIGILFQPALARANVEGRKTQTRRLRKLQQINADPDKWHLWQPRISEETGEWAFTTNPLQGEKGEIVRIKCPYGKAGDVMWQRENWGMSYVDKAANRSHVVGGTWGSPARPDRVPCVVFTADGPIPDDSPYETARPAPSIHMPRWASRFVRPITRIRCERIQSITYEECCIERGAPLKWEGEGPEPYRRNMIGALRSLWVDINGVESWERNWWCWVVEYAKEGPCAKP